MTPTETISVMSLKKLTDLFRETFEDESLVLRPDLTARDVEKWDSFNHISLVIGIETIFDITLTTKEISAMGNVGDLIACLQGKDIDIAWGKDRF
ncbi:MAG: acyl carrier protein [Rhodospirillaceae bacterium]|jgi:acyl carrier protein|nr:acyl carrier protein [Rhodospirillaceae bacterium]|tara:strand:+ start:1303 stop:1587 length:285 start_codon:yes stop_codon:yes gene_type:complete